MYDTGSKSGTSGEEEDLQEVLAGSWQSTTPASKPMTHDKIYYFLPYWDDKPCLHVRSIDVECITATLLAKLSISW